MRHGNGSVSIQQKLSNGLTYDVATADDNSLLTSDIYASEVQ